MTEPLRVKIKDWVEIVAIVLAGSWAMWTFWFSEYFKPDKTRGYLQLRVEISRQGEPQSVDGLQMQPVLVSIQAANPTKRKLEVSSGYFTVHASALGSADDKYFTASKIDETLNAEKSGRSAFVGPTARSLIYVAGFFSGWIFDENEAQQTTKLLWVPVDCYHYLEANAYVLSSVAPSKVSVRQKVNTSTDVDFLVSSSFFSRVLDREA